MMKILYAFVVILIGLYFFIGFLFVEDVESFSENTKMKLQWVEQVLFFLFWPIIILIYALMEDNEQ